MYTYWDIVRNCRVLVFTTRIGFLWTVLPVLYYTISALTLNYSGDMYLNYFYASIPGIPAFFLTIFSNNIIGRKKTTLLGCFLGGMFVGVVPLIPKSAYYRYALTMGVTFVARLFSSVAFYGIFPWTSELFPTVLRGLGIVLDAWDDSCHAGMYVSAEHKLQFTIYFDGCFGVTWLLCSDQSA